MYIASKFQIPMKREQIQRQLGALQYRGRPRPRRRRRRRGRRPASANALPAVSREQRDVPRAAEEREEPLPEGQDRAGARLGRGQSAAPGQARPDQGHGGDDELKNVANARTD